MATPNSSHAFTSPDSPGDVQVVLVLLESSADMLSYWAELQSWYLPTLLGALQGNNPDTLVRICWRTTADPVHQQPIFSGAANQVPAIRFDSPVPLSITSLWSGVETLQAVCRELSERTTRHLLVVAVNPPQDPANFHTQGGHAPEAATRDAVIKTLRQERIRLHMVLGNHPRFRALRDFHRQMLQLQISVEAPLWFQVDPTKFTFHLAAKPAAFESGGGAGSFAAHGPSMVPPRSEPATPTSTAVALPVSSPQSAGSPRESAPATSPSRRSRTKGKDAASPSIDAQGPGLVNYLKQVHGLTKKRNYGAKTSKRAVASESTRASTSSRPILPRLDLPPATLTAPSHVDGDKEKQPAAESAQPAASAVASRYQPIAPALPLTAARGLSSDDSRRISGRRWPWLQPAPVAPSMDASGLTPEANSALQSLTHMTPLVPPFNNTTEQSAGRAGHRLIATSGQVTTRSPPRQATYPPYGVSAGSSPSPPRRSPPQVTGMSSPTYHSGIPVEFGASETSTQTYQSPIAAHEMQHAPMYAGQPHYGGYSYAVSPQNSQGSSPHPSTAPAAAAGGGGVGDTRDDPENQPFVITQEYEAFANARFEEALRSGDLHASMSPATLSPVAASPLASSAGYFAAAPPADPLMASAPLQQGPQAEYAPFAQQPAAHLRHDVMHYQSAPGSSSDPGQPANYYQPSGADPSSSHPQWYGS